LLTFYKRYARTAFDISLIIVTVYIIMLIFSYIFNIAKPIFYAILIYYFLRPLTRKLERLPIGKSLAVTIAMLSFVLIILLVGVLFSFIIIEELIYFANVLPNYTIIISDILAKKITFIEEQLANLPVSVTQNIDIYLQRAAEWGGNFLSTTILAIINYLKNVPSIIINLLLAIILAYFLSLESDRWVKIVKEKTPQTFKKAYFFVKDKVIDAIISYIIAQLKLISLTFVIILFVLIILQVPNSLLIALVTALIDLLPVLGISTVFVPWITYLFIVGETHLGIYLAILYIALILLRQFLEPRLVGESLGVSAFTTLSFMVISLSLFGVAGVILSPILLILLKSLYEEGYLARWIHLPKEEFHNEGEH